MAANHGTRNPNLEIRNPKQIQNSQIQMLKTPVAIEGPGT
jgi:hypothetical protein